MHVKEMYLIMRKIITKGLWVKSNFIKSVFFSKPWFTINYDSKLVAYYQIILSCKLECLLPFCSYLLIAMDIDPWTTRVKSTKKKKKKKK